MATQPRTCRSWTSGLPETGTFIRHSVVGRNTARGSFTAQGAHLPQLEAGLRKLDAGPRKLDAGPRKLDAGPRKLDPGPRTNARRTSPTERAGLSAEIPMAFNGWPTCLASARDIWAFTDPLS
jgi:hypothetical protein